LIDLHLVNRLSIDTQLVLATVGTFLISYIFTFPSGWLISDEYSYLNQGIALARGENSLSFIDAISKESIPYKGTDYPLGNAFWIAFWIKVCGLNYAYIGSLISVLASAFIIYKILAKESLYKFSLVLLFVYPSLAFFSNSFMSCMPSLLAVSIFMYVLFHANESGKKWFILSFIAAISFWIRETNIVLLGSICIIHFLQDRRWFLFYVGGTIIGFLPRMISSYYLYNDPLYYVLGENFSIYNFISNVGVYGILLLCFMPLGLFFIKSYRGRYFLPLQISTLLFILMYLFYSFNSTMYSGFYKGIILMGRFLIPLLPIYIISVGWYFQKAERNKTLGFIDTTRFKYSITILLSILIIAMQFFVCKEARLHKEISNHIYSNYSDKMVLYDLSRTTNVIRYINPFHGSLSFTSDISNLGDDMYMNKLFTKFDKAYLIQTINSANKDKLEYTSTIDDMIKDAGKIYSIEEIDNIKIKPSLYLQVLEINANYGKEK
jgi:hypothetical protein